MMVDMLISSSILITLIFFIRTLVGGRLPGRLYVMLWSIALFRLVLPINLPILPRIRNNISSLPSFVGTTAETVSMVYEYILTGIWIIGMIISFTVFVLNYRKERMTLAQSLPFQIALDGRETAEEIPLRVSDRILSPAIYGIWKPSVVLPKAMNLYDEKSLSYVLLHEKAHIFWKDNLLKLFSILVLCIYWFDPFVWIACCFLSKDMEHACDEEAIANMKTEERREYATLLYRMADYKSSLFFIFNGFGQNAVKERIGKIMRFKKHTKLAMILGIIFAVLSAIAVFASGAKDDPQIVVEMEEEASTETADYVKNPVNEETEDFTSISDTAVETEDTDFTDSSMKDTDSRYSAEGYDLHPYYRGEDSTYTDEEIIEIEKLHEYNRNYFKNMEN